MKTKIKEVKINKVNKSLALVYNGITVSQFGIADEILDYITNLQKENEKLKTLKESITCLYNEMVALDIIDEYEENIEEL